MRGLQRSPALVKLLPRLFRSHGVAGSIDQQARQLFEYIALFLSGRVSVWLRGCGGSLRSCQQHSTLMSHEQHTRTSHIDSLHHRIAIHKESDMPPRASQTSAAVQHTGKQLFRGIVAARLHVQGLLTPGKHETAADRSTLPTTVLCRDGLLVAACLRILLGLDLPLSSQPEHITSIDTKL